METKQYHFQTPWNYNHRDNRGEKNYGKSVTVPDLNLSIQQILDNFSRGISNDQFAKFPIGEDDPTFEDIDITQDPSFDIIDAKNMMDNISERQRAKKQKDLDIQKAIQDEKDLLYKKAQEAKNNPILPGLPPPEPGLKDPATKLDNPARSANKGRSEAE